ncbi:MAG: hypothetical protein JSS67_04660 [Bacteroidetes bacterium]|nr:hypothetical protein [Bacteroidota bacterium]
MFIAVRASEDQKKEFLQKGIAPELEVIFFAIGEPIHVSKEPDAVFDFTESNNYMEEFPSHIPVFKNAVISTLEHFPKNFIRMNAWPGFICRDIMEVAFHDEMKEKVASIMNALSWKYLQVPDIPGLIAARIICMIINEAWYALDDQVSTKTEIDTAMKLGTNYPFGPFEWGDKIGLHQVVTLLNKLSENDPRYLPSSLLLKASLNA